MPRDAVSRTSHVGTVGTNGLIVTLEYIFHSEKSCLNLVRPNQICNYTFPIDWVSNVFPFGAKSVGIAKLQSKFGSDWQYSEKISLRATSMKKTEKKTL